MLGWDQGARVRALKGVQSAIRALLLIVLVTAPALAQSDVTVGGEVIMRLPASKAANAQAHIDRLLEAGADPEGILAKKTPGGFGVFWGTTLLVEVDKALASENKSTPEGLAIAWAQRLYDLVGPGYLQVTPKSVMLPIGSSTVLQVSGLAQGEISVQGGDGVVIATSDSVAGTITLTANAVGRSSIVVLRGKGKVRIPVRVKDWAGYPPEEVSIKVTGHPAPGAIIAEASLTAVAGSTRLNPGARLRFPEQMPSIPSVDQGRSLRFALPLEIVAGDDYFPVSTKVNVQVQSVELEIKESNLLVVSNRPERVEKDGVLMEYTFSDHEPTRLMYSHLNETLADRNLWVNLYNETDQPVEVWIGSSFAGPNRNEVHTGHMAAVRFLQQSGSVAGYIVEIPAGKRFVVADHLMQKRDLLSGFANFQIVGHGKLRVEVHSALAPARNETRGVERLGGPFNPFKIHPHGVFAQPYFEEWVDLTNSSDPVSVPFGISPWLIDFETGLPNTGNFGVLYRYHFVLSNKGGYAVDFELVFRPTAGPGAGTFLVDGDLLEAPFARAGVETSLGRFRVDPGDERTVDVVTLPEASSNYPAYLEMRPLR
jgi:hypothetical protein